MPKDKSSPGLPDILGFITSLQEEKKEKFPKPQKKKRGRPAKYSDEVMTKISFVMLSKGIKEFKALWRYLKDNPQVRKSCGLKQLPDRTTLMRRLKNFPP
jgi:transposase